MNGNWIAVASAEHVRCGVAGDFMQVCHGEAAPLRRMAAGDRVVYYSPTKIFGGKDKLQAFTAIGVVKAGPPYQVDMGQGLRPFRRDVAWLGAQAAPIQPLLDHLEFSAGQKNWGYRFRFGLLPVSGHDIARIARAMAVGRLSGSPAGFLVPAPGQG